jgi:hypothetical protein
MNRTAAPCAYRSEGAQRRAARDIRPLLVDAALAVAGFAALCVLVLSVPPQLGVEPDDGAYRHSIVAMAGGDFLTLSSEQLNALAGKLGGRSVPNQWIELPDGRYISEKDPGYPFLAAPFQALGIIRWAPLFYGALACLGLFIGARRWLGRFGGPAAVGLYCSSGAALLFAWRDYMPTFTDASLIAAGTGALLWAVLATEASRRRRTGAGIAGFAAVELATFVRYSNSVILGCAVVAVFVAWRRPAARLPGYRAGEIRFGLGAITSNLRHMPVHLAQAMPMLTLGLAALAWITVRWLVLRRAGGQIGAVARRDLGVGLAVASSWFAVWAVYSAYYWTTDPSENTLQTARFYVPAIGPIALLGAWLVTRVRGRAWLAGLTSAAVVAAMFGLGMWSFHAMVASIAEFR